MHKERKKKLINKKPRCFISMRSTTGTVSVWPAGPRHPGCPSSSTSPLTWIAAQHLSAVPLDPSATASLSLSLSSSSTVVTGRRARGAAHSPLPRRLVSSDCHARCVLWTDLAARVALLLKFLCQIPDEDRIAGSARLAGLSSPRLLNEGDACWVHY